MEPKIKDGDVVAIHCQPMVENGEIAAVLIDGEATLKRVFLFDDHIELRAPKIRLSPPSSASAKP